MRACCRRSGRGMTRSRRCAGAWKGLLWRLIGFPVPSCRLSGARSTGTHLLDAVVPGERDCCRTSCDIGMVHGADSTVEKVRRAALPDPQRSTHAVIVIDFRSRARVCREVEREANRLGRAARIRPSCDTVGKCRSRREESYCDRCSSSLGNECITHFYPQILSSQA